MAQPARVPVYKLYGELEPWPTPDMVHCERIADRSRLHDWQIRLHRHHGLHQLLYLQKGSARASHDGRLVHLKPGDVVVVPQMCVHGFHFSVDAVGYVVTLGYPLLNRLTAQMDATGAPSASARVHAVPDAERAQVDLLFETLQSEYLGTRRHRNAAIEAALIALLVWAGRQHDAQGEDAHVPEAGRRQRHFDRFCELIEAHYAEQWPVEKYAGLLGITAAHLNALCRQVAGRSALELIHQRVMLEARRQLVYTSMTISAISYALGFADPAYFTRFFKRLVHISPREFRRQTVALLND